MAPGNEVAVADLSEWIVNQHNEPGVAGADELLDAWSTDLKCWADSRLRAGDKNLLDTAGPVFERTLLRAALQYTGEYKQKAAALIGWGRNTVTRKLKELGALNRE